MTPFSECLFHRPCALPLRSCGPGTVPKTPLTLGNTKISNYYEKRRQNPPPRVWAPRNEAEIDPENYTKIHAQYDWTTGALDNENEWRKFRAVRHLYPSLVPLASPCFVLRFIGVETETLSDY